MLGLSDGESLGLSDSERISMIRSAVLTQYTRVTDGRTDGQTDRRTDGIGVAYTRYSIYAVARKKNHLFVLSLFVSASAADDRERLFSAEMEMGHLS